MAISKLFRCFNKKEFATTAPPPFTEGDLQGRKVSKRDSSHSIASLLSTSLQSKLKNEDEWSNLDPYKVYLELKNTTAVKKLQEKQKLTAHDYSVIHRYSDTLHEILRDMKEFPSDKYENIQEARHQILGDDDIEWTLHMIPQAEFTFGKKPRVSFTFKELTGFCTLCNLENKKDKKIAQNFLKNNLSNQELYEKLYQLDKLGIRQLQEVERNSYTPISYLTLVRLFAYYPQKEKLEKIGNKLEIISAHIKSNQITEKDEKITKADMEFFRLYAMFIYDNPEEKYTLKTILTWAEKNHSEDVKSMVQLVNKLTETYNEFTQLWQQEANIHSGDIAVAPDKHTMKLYVTDDSIPMLSHATGDRGYLNQPMYFKNVLNFSTWRLNISALLNKETAAYQALLAKYETEEKLNEVMQEKYEQIEQIIHQNKIANFKDAFITPESVSKTTFGTLFLKHRRSTPRQDFHSMHRKFMGIDKSDNDVVKETKKKKRPIEKIFVKCQSFFVRKKYPNIKYPDQMWKVNCLAFSVKATMAALVELQEQLKGELLEEDSALDINDLILFPVDERESIKRMSPERFVEKLQKKGYLEKVEQPEILSSIFSK